MTPIKTLTEKAPVVRRQEPTITKKQIRTLVVLAFPFIIERLEAWTGVNPIEELSELLDLAPTKVITWIIPAAVWVLYVVSTHVPLVDRLLHLGVTNTDPEVARKAQAEVVEIVVEGKSTSVEVDMPESQRDAAQRLREWAGR